jgi:alpha-1,3-rhamnosyl/mannosyltransferase
MRILINGLSALKARTGVGHHVAELHQALVKEFPEDVFMLYPGELIHREWPKRIRRRSSGSAPGGQPGRVRQTLASAAKNLAQLGSCLHFSVYSRAFSFDLYHEPNFLPFHSHLPTIVTVHDLSVLKYPQWHPADRVRQHQQHFLTGLQRAQQIIVVSEAVRTELIQELGCAPTRVTTIPNGIGTQYCPQSQDTLREVRARLGLPEKYFLCVGTIEPRKNLLTVMRAFVDLPSELRQQCPLILAGPWGWRAEAERDFFLTQAGPAGARTLGYTSAHDLPALYSAARVLLYPSFYEGFGMPPTEMLACGGAVIASDVPVLREVLGTHAEFAAPDAVHEWKTLMARSVTDNEYLDQLKSGGILHAQQFTWQRAARETHALYSRVLASESLTLRHVTDESRSRH